MKNKIQFKFFQTSLFIILLFVVGILSSMITQSIVEQKYENKLYTQSQYDGMWERGCDLGCIQYNIMVTNSTWNSTTIDSEAYYDCSDFCLNDILYSDIGVLRE